MLSPRITPRRSSSDEAEKPFWISYADLMTALMVLFLVVMLASLLALTQSVRQAAKINAENQAQAAELQDIRAKEQQFRELRTKVLAALEKRAPAEVSIDRSRGVINYGSRATFPSNRADLTAAQKQLLRSFLPSVIAVANTAAGERVIKRVIIEGFADPRGTYLHNVHLSAARSENVLCALLEPGTPRLSRAITEQTRALFATAGASSTSLKKNNRLSRRIEMRLEYFTADEFERAARRPAVPAASGGIGRCEASVGG